MSKLGVVKFAHNNDCFFNSTIQLLFSSKAFANAFNLKDEKDQNTIRDEIRDNYYNGLRGKTEDEYAVSISDAYYDINITGGSGGDPNAVIMKIILDYEKIRPLFRIYAEHVTDKFHFPFHESITDSIEGTARKLSKLLIIFCISDDLDIPEQFIKKIKARVYKYKLVGITIGKHENDVGHVVAIVRRDLSSDNYQIIDDMKPNETTQDTLTNIKNKYKNEYPTTYLILYERVDSLN